MSRELEHSIWPPLRLARLRCAHESVSVVLPVAPVDASTNKEVDNAHHRHGRSSRFAELVALEAGEFKSLGRVATDQASIERFAETLAKDDQVVLEPTSNALDITRILRPRVERVAVANPLQVRLTAHAKIKTDKIDAAAFAQLHATGFLPEIWVPNSETESLRRRISRRRQLIRRSTRLKTEIHSVLMANLIEKAPMKDLFGASGRRWLAEQKLPDHDRDAVNQNLRELDQIRQDLRASDTALAKLAVDDARVQRLITLTGVNMLAALAIISAIGDVTHFPSPEKLVSYLGLNPRVRQSGNGPARHGRITEIRVAEAPFRVGPRAGSQCF